jgi:hypothetical protein
MPRNASRNVIAESGRFMRKWATHLRVAVNGEGDGRLGLREVVIE